MKEQQGVLYWNHGSRCLARLVVSAHSLRSAGYAGRAVLLNEGPPPAWLRPVMADLDVEVREIPLCYDYGLVKKSRLWHNAPFRRTMFVDSDTLMLANAQEFLEQIASDGRCVLTQFATWGTARGRMARRIKQWEVVSSELVQAAYAYGRAVNTGVMGWVELDPLLPHYEDLTAKGALHKSIGRKTLDEVAMQLAVTRHPHTMLDERWNTSCIYGDFSRAALLHYHGHKHVREGVAQDKWRAAFAEVCKRWPAAELASGAGDASIAKWLKDSSRPARLRDMTIVTAVNPRYADVAKKNFAMWAQTPGLREQDFVVFVNGFKRPSERRWIEKTLPNCRVVRWEYKDATERETMLAAFVLGVPDAVQTRHWMKLDADTSPVAEKWEWPEHKGQTIVSHKWGYTKMKGEENPRDHWFNRLDRLFAGNRPVFSRQLDPVKDYRVSHRKGNPDKIPMRFGSFAHIERTDFTRKVARLVRRKCGGRLPIPSHDTLVWYFATLWGEPVKLVDMKRYFKP